MSDTPTPAKGPAKRRGLALPPRGQALARLQDLEEEIEQNAEKESAIEDSEKTPHSTAGSNAVRTAGSNAVINEVSDAVRTDYTVGQPPMPSVQPQPVQEAARSGHQGPVRAIREPTTRITVDMPDSLHRKIALLSVETRRSIKDLVIEALTANYFSTETDGQ